jgi:integrase/recombinase XerD
MAVRVYCKWLYQEGYVSYHVGEDMRLPKVKKKLPGHLLSFQEVELVLSEPDTTTALGVRDRAMLEVLYSAGLRRKELVGILVEDVDFMRGQLFVRNAKGGVERYVPLGRRAIMWLDKYLVDVRPVLVVNPSERALFLGFRGSVLSIHQLGQIVKGYLLKAGIEGPGSCHLFRHSCATQMLDNGADIRYIQQFLGHRDITSTQVYTQVSLAKLKEVHAKCHPAEKGREKE